MGAFKFTDTELRELVRKGLSGSAIAKYLGVSKSSVSERLKALNIAMSKDVTIRSAPKIADCEINALDQLRKINRDANELLDLLIRGKQGERRSLGSRVKGHGSKTDPPGNTIDSSVQPDEAGRVSWVTCQVSKTNSIDNCAQPDSMREGFPVDLELANLEQSEAANTGGRGADELALKAMAEIRGQLKLQLEIYQVLFDMQAAREFQAEALEIIEEVSPEARDEIIRRLTEKNALRSALDLEKIIAETKTS